MTAVSMLVESEMIKNREVLTLEEVARYLRLPKDTVVRQAAQGAIPGRQIEDTWRFLKAAIDDWLRSYYSRTLLLQQASALTEDETLPALLKTIYATRKRPEVATRRS
jgi:excisionase family DNA binding protein